MKKLMTICLIISALAVSSDIVSANITNGGFETGDLTGWTYEDANSGHNGATGNALSVTEDYHYSGGHALWGSASLLSDCSAWNGQEDWSRTYAWSDAQNLSDVNSIQLYLTDFRSNPPPLQIGAGDRKSF
ncbi:MAG: hypothetical protein NTW93_10255 [Phycisphaerae bacterium]|nr:hypothetical protein [Phycisphaerae bacterium]